MHGWNTNIIFFAWGSGGMCHGCLLAWVYFPHESKVPRSGWGKRIDWCTPKAHPDIPDMCLDLGLLQRHSCVLVFAPWDSLILLARNRKYSQCCEEKHSIVPSPALTSNLHWPSRELELLSDCRRILCCDSGMVKSETTQIVHTTAYSSINILPASMLNAILFLWKCSKNSRTTLCFKGQNVNSLEGRSTWHSYQHLE